ncbi:MAG: N-formylglutamate deformylase [Gammaproteobacteria bacterium]|jgi:formiminoglutamase
MKPTIVTGRGPLLLAQPHGGTEIPGSIRARLNDNGLAMADTDWHIGRLYAGLAADSTTVSTPVHRYVIDANRAPDDQSLYPGQNTTGLCPTTTFDGVDIYLPGQAPSRDEVEERRVLYHQPYHDALREQLDRIRQRHGFAILYDCHSIRSVVPYLFGGKLPDFNIGSNNGASCGPEIENAVREICESAVEYETVVNGRFKGGWTTRHYGEPDRGFHAIQMELAQCNYMLERAPWTYEPASADKLRAILAAILQNLPGAFD